MPLQDVLHDVRMSCQLGPTPAVHSYAAPQLLALRLQLRLAELDLVTKIALQALRRKSSRSKQLNRLVAADARCVHASVQERKLSGYQVRINLY